MSLVSRNKRGVKRERVIENVDFQCFRVQVSARLIALFVLVQGQDASDSQVMNARCEL